MKIDEIIEGLERSNKQEELFLNAHSWMESGEIKERKYMIDRDESIIAYLKELKELKNSTIRRENAGMTSEKAKEVLIKNRMIGSFELADAIDFAIKALEQEPKTGHWIMPVQDDGMSDPMYYQVRCSKCGFDLDPQTWHMELHQYDADKYCPKCGTPMIEPQESED